MSDLFVVRMGQSISRDECRRRTGGSTTIRSPSKGNVSILDENMMRIVERVTLDNLVEDRRKTLHNNNNGGGGGNNNHHQNGPNLKIADIRKQILEQVDVVCCTLSGAGSQPMLEIVLRMTGFKFDAIIIDEAGQAVESSSLIPFKYNPQAVVLVGDPCQLPATVFSRIAKEANFSQSLFQRLQLAGYPVQLLETQYRMHPLIAEYPSRRYYEGRLVTCPHMISSDSHHMPYHDDVCGKFKPYLFHNVDQSIETFDGTSVFNRIEAKYVIDLFEELVNTYPQHSNNIGIIAPYKAQRKLLNGMLRERFKYNGNRKQSDLPKLSYDDLDTEISTIDGFQGREKNIVIFSCVRAPQSTDYQRKNTTGIGFLKEWQRLNVAVTRSRYALWIVGHRNTLSNDPEWKYLLDFTLSKDCIYNATIAMDAGSGDCSNGGGSSSMRVWNENQQRQDGKHKPTSTKNKQRKTNNHGNRNDNGRRKNNGDYNRKRNDIVNVSDRNDNVGGNNGADSRSSISKLRIDRMRANALNDECSDSHNYVSITTEISGANIKSIHSTDDISCSSSSGSSSSNSSSSRGVSFICKKQGQSIPDLHTQSTGSLLDNISIAYGSSVARELIDFSYDNRNHCPQRDKHLSALHHDHNVDNDKHHDGYDDVGSIHIAWTGKVSNANYSTRKAIYILFINNRLVECTSIRKTIESVYSDILPRHAYPFVYLSIM